jgi:hypothetical protein
VVRLRLDDTSQFAELSKTQQVAKSPLREAVSTAWRPILQVIGLMIIFNIGFYVVFTFLPKYTILSGITSALTLSAQNAEPRQTLSIHSPAGRWLDQCHKSSRISICVADSHIGCRTAGGSARAERVPGPAMYRSDHSLFVPSMVAAGAG